MRTAMWATVMVCALAAVAGAYAENQIYQYNNALHEGDNYSIDQYNKTVEISLAEPGQTFMFEAATLSGGQYAGPGDIDYIFVDADAGPVDIVILPKPDSGHDYGAQDVGKINLRASGVTGRILGMLLSGNAATEGPIYADALVGDVNAEAEGYGQVLNAVEFGDFDGGFRCNGLQNFTVSGSSRSWSGIVVNGPYSHTMTINGPMDVISIWGTMSGHVHVTDQLHNFEVADAANYDLSGGLTTESGIDFLTVSGDISGMVDVGTSLGGTSSYSISGTIKVGQNAGAVQAHEVASTAMIEIVNDLGEVWIWGAGGAFDGSLVVHHDTTGWLRFDYSVTNITIDHDMSGPITIADKLYGGITVGHDVLYVIDVYNFGIDGSAYIDIGGKLAGTVMLAGSIGNGAGIDIHGDLTGTIDCAGNILSGSTGTPGHIAVDGAFGSATENATVYVRGGQIGTRAFVCFNHDGSGSDGLDVWHAGSCVYKGNTQYTAPNPSARIFCPVPSHGRGDCDGVCAGTMCVGFDDINPFVACIPYNPATGEPALTIAVPFMADMDCDGVVSFGDIDPFVALIPGPCPPPCGEQMMMGGMQMEMATVVDEGTLAGQAALSGAIYAVVDSGADPFTADEWEAIFAAAAGGEQ